MRKIQINIASDKKSYPIFVGSGILDAITKFDLYSYSKIVVITDGEKGSYAVDKDGQIFKKSVLKTEVVEKQNRLLKEFKEIGLQGVAIEVARDIEKIKKRVLLC